MRKHLCLLIAFSILIAMQSFSVELPKDFTYDSHNSRDPFVPLVGMTEEPKPVAAQHSVGEIQFQGVGMGAGGQIIAIINGEPYKKGEKTDYFTVKEISKNTVIVNVDGTDYTLVLYEEY